MQALRTKTAETETDEQLKIVVKDRVTRLHPTIQDLKRTCRETDKDKHGFFVPGNQYHPEFKLGREGVDRGMRILDALARAAEKRGHDVILNGGHLEFIIYGEPLALRLHESAAKSPHTPTRAELADQARHERWGSSSTYPDGSPRTVYPKWDYFPSGRLRLDLYDPHHHGYRDRHQARWIERGATRIEQKLNDVMVTLVIEAEVARQHRLEREEAARKAAEEAERRRIAAALAERSRRINVLFDEVATLSARADRLEALRNRLQRSDLAEYPELTAELDAVIDQAQSEISTRALAQALSDIPEFPDPKPERRYPWQ